MKIVAQTINYDFFTARCCGIEMCWINLNRNTYWAKQPYMERYKLFPNQIKL